MKKIYLIALAIISLSFATSAQKVSGTVKGILQDSVSGSPLGDATVSIVRIKDSSLISFAITGSNGSFEIKNLDAGEYNLVSSFSGLQTNKKPFSITTNNQHADLGIVKLDRIYKNMQEVVIEEAPVKVNGDTLSFKADVFKTKPNATVEDLLKKMPGMTVDKDGTVKAQGEQVQKVYVDGKEFFSNDPKLATKNLTADMVDRVDVFDDMSEQAKFNGIDDGSRSKAINLKLKKDKKKGLFGKTYAGYGTDDRYDAGVTANYFKGAMQSSLIAKSNNTNNLGFTFSDMLGMFGGGNTGGGMTMGGGSGGGFTMGGGGNGGGGMNVMSMGGGMNMGGGFSGLNLGSSGSGITSSSQAGLNYRDTWSKYFDVNGSYSFNRTETNNLRKSLRQTFASDTTYFTDQIRNSYSKSDNHRFNLNMIYSIDSFNSIIYSPNINFQKSTNNYDDTTAYSYATPTFTKNTNQTRSVNNGSGDGTNWTNNLIWRKKFSRPGRTLSVNMSNTMNDNDRDNYNVIQSLINPRNVFTNTDAKTRNYAGGFSYTEPLARNKILEFNYNYSHNQSEQDKETFSYNAATGNYDIANAPLSNHFESLTESHRAGSNFRLVEKKFNFQVGFAVQKTSMENNNFTKSTFQTQDYTNLFPTASFNYQFARSKSFRFNYRGSTRQPSITQLQDVLDISNSPYFYRGNPSLKQEFNNNFILSYNNFNLISFRNFFAFFTFSQTSNKIANSVTINPDGTQLTTPVNLNGAYNLTGNINLGFPIKQMKGGNFNTTTRLTYNRDPSISNGKMNYGKNLNIAEDLRLNYNYKEKLDVGITASTNYTSFKNTNASNAAQDQSYFTHNYSADITYSFPKGFILATDFDYTFYTGRTDGYNQSYAQWNASFAKTLFKNQRGELKASVFDILDQNRSVTRNTGTGYIEDVENSVLKRFYILTFTYKINRMGGRQIPANLERMTKGIRF